MLATSCTSNSAYTDQGSKQTNIQLPEEVKFLTDGRTFSTRCAGYDRLSGRNQGVIEAQTWAKEEAVDANFSHIHSRFKELTQCNEHSMTMECNKSLDIFRQTISDGFIRKAEKKIIDYPDNIVCVSLIGMVSVPEVSDLMENHSKQKSSNINLPSELNKTTDKDKISLTHTNDSFSYSKENINNKEASSKTKSNKSNNNRKPDNLLINGDFTKHYSTGWGIINESSRGIKKAEVKDKNLIISYKGKGDNKVQWALSQIVKIDINKPFYFETVFSTPDDIDTDVYPSIKLQLLNNQRKVEAEVVWTSDEYYYSKYKFIRHSTRLGERQIIHFNSDSDLIQLLPSEKIKGINNLKVVFDVSAPENERCRLCELTIEKTELNYFNNKELK